MCWLVLMAFMLCTSRWCCWTLACRAFSQLRLHPSHQSQLITPGSIPSEYHDLQAVFSKDHALSLPPHRSYDWGIDILPSGPFPWANYSICQNQRTRQWRNISLTPLQQVSSGPPPPWKVRIFLYGQKRKKTLHPSIGYRGRNEITIKNKYPLLLIDSAFGLHQREWRM